MSSPEPEYIKAESLFSAFTAKLGFESIYKDPVQCKLHQGFVFPIEYLNASELHAVHSSVAADLEFSGIDGSGSGPGSVSGNMTRRLCDPDNEFGNTLSQEMAQLYTSNADYLRQTQEVVESMATCKRRPINAVRFREIWNDIKEDSAFLEKHSFMEWKALEDLNKSKSFLQLYSVMNIVSPVFSIVLPLVMLIFPFVILKIQGIELTFQQYTNTLKDIAKSHFIGKALNIQNFSVESVLYFLFIFGVYALQMYQNVMSCFRYYNSVRRMNENLCDLYSYLDATTENMEEYVKSNKDRALYSEFCGDVDSNRMTLVEMRDRVGGDLSRFCLNPRKLMDLGRMLEIYYILYSNVEYEEALRYSVGFEGYLSTIEGVYRNYNSGRLGKCDFVESGDNDSEDEDDESNNDSESEYELDSGSVECGYTSFKKQYYPPHVFDESDRVVVKNNITLKKNRIITGVNASGKTTTLKTTAINILVSQQYGFGFYESASVLPVHHIHSYLNIPDTSGRDSLFQAESRRCKDILDKIRTSAPDQRHFCLFDELYSGTNPKDATKSAISLLKFLALKKNVRFVLTTHYVDVCTSLEKNGNIDNWKMDVVVNEETGRIEEYTYKISRGISTLEGGIEILKNMDYPDEILKDLEDTDEK